MGADQSNAPPLPSTLHSALPHAIVTLTCPTLPFPALPCCGGPPPTVMTGQLKAPLGTRQVDTTPPCPPDLTALCPSVLADPAAVATLWEQNKATLGTPLGDTQAYPVQEDKESCAFKKAMTGLVTYFSGGAIVFVSGRGGGWALRAGRH